MQQPLADSTAALTPAFCLTYRGVAEDADKPRLIGLFTKLLRLPGPEAEKALGSPPILLTSDIDRDKLRRHQLGLAKIGCISSIDEAWKYQRWSIPAVLKARFEHQPVRPRVYALLQIQPSPGFGRLHAISARLQDIECHALNHGDLLLDSSADHPEGAGNWLRRVRKALAPLLRDWGREYQLQSSFALIPQDGEHLEDLLETLQRRLNQPAESQRDTKLQQPAWPIAGARWRLLLKMPHNAMAQANLGESERAWLEANWPAGSGCSEFDAAELRRVPGWLSEFTERAGERQKRGAQLEQRFSSLDRLPSLPTVAMKIHRLAQDENSSPEALTETVEQDPSLSTRLLAIVNSAYFGLRSRVDTIAHALVILGREELSHLALLVSSETLFRGLSRDTGQALWRHSVRTAELARLLARNHGHPHPATLYTAALLHDVGKIFLLSFAEQELDQIVDKARRYDLPSYELEREHFGHDHATLGAAMLRRWDLPESICRCVEQHHGVAPGADGPDLDAALVALADHLAHRVDDDEIWADQTRLRRSQFLAVKPLLGTQDLDTLDLMIEDLREQLRPAL